MTAVLQIETYVPRRDGRVPQIRVCPVCGGVQTVTASAAASVAPGEIVERICAGCHHVGADLVRALGVPPDGEDQQ